MVGRVGVRFAAVLRYPVYRDEDDPDNNSDNDSDNDTQELDASAF